MRIKFLCLQFLLFLPTSSLFAPGLVFPFVECRIESLEIGKEYSLKKSKKEKSISYILEIIKKEGRCSDEWSSGILYSGTLKSARPD